MYRKITVMVVLMIIVPRIIALAQVQTYEIQSNDYIGAEVNTGIAYSSFTNPRDYGEDIYSYYVIHEVTVAGTNGTGKLKSFWEYETDVTIERSGYYFENLTGSQKVVLESGLPREKLALAVEGGELHIASYKAWCYDSNDNLVAEKYIIFDEVTSDPGGTTETETEILDDIRTQLNQIKSVIDTIKLEVDQLEEITEAIRNVVDNIDIDLDQVKSDIGYIKIDIGTIKNEVVSIDDTTTIIKDEVTRTRQVIEENIIPTQTVDNYIYPDYGTIETNKPTGLPTQEFQDTTVYFEEGQVIGEPGIFPETPEIPESIFPGILKEQELIKDVELVKQQELIKDSELMKDVELIKDVEIVKDMELNRDSEMTKSNEMNRTMIFQKDQEFQRTWVEGLPRWTNP